MQVLFEMERRQADPIEALERNLAELGGADEEFAMNLLEGTLLREQEIKDAVQKHAPDWSLDRMDPISRCVLLFGAYELLFGNDAPPAVVMDEAIEIAKEFGTSESGKFVNGVLNAIAHSVQPK
jgi:N utilization substance protein B